MAIDGPETARETPSAMTSLPRLEDLPAIEGGFDEQAVRDAFESFRRHAVQLQAQLRVLQAARRSVLTNRAGSPAEAGRPPATGGRGTALPRRERSPAKRDRHRSPQRGPPARRRREP